MNWNRSSKLSIVCLLPIIVVFFLGTGLSAQTSNQESFDAINKVWAKFYTAYETLDPEPLKEIHSKQLVRVSGGKRVSNYKTYMKSVARRFEKAKEQGTSYKISLRFFERALSDHQASERGVYRLTVFQKDRETDYFGQFHVIHVKKGNKWKILVDYDSNEGKTIGVEQFEAAHAIDDLKPFINQ